MDTSLDGKTAVVTGGSQGIGRGICIELAREGVNTVVADMNTEGGEGVAEEIKRGGAGKVILLEPSQDDPRSFLPTFERHVFFRS